MWSFVIFDNWLVLVGGIWNFVSSLCRRFLLQLGGKFKPYSCFIFHIFRNYYLFNFVQTDTNKTYRFSVDFSKLFFDQQISSYYIQMTFLEFTPRHMEFFVFSFKTAKWIISLDRFRSPCDYLAELPI